MYSPPLVVVSADMSLISFNILITICTTVFSMECFYCIKTSRGIMKSLLRTFPHWYVSQSYCRNEYITVLHNFGDINVTVIWADAIRPFVTTAALIFNQSLSAMLLAQSHTI